MRSKKSSKVLISGKVDRAKSSDTSHVGWCAATIAVGVISSIVDDGHRGDKATLYTVIQFVEVT